MDESNPANSNSIFGKGPWMRKKRYEEEDFTFSPPDDSGFLPLKIGLHPTVAHESMLDRINHELGFMEISKPQTSTGSCTSNSLTASILFGSSNITFGTQDSSNPLTFGQQQISVVAEEGIGSPPKIFIPPTITERRESQAELSCLSELEDRPEFSRVAREDAATLVSKARSGRPTRKISMNLENTINRRVLLENIQSFSISSADSVSPVKEEEQAPLTHTPKIPFLEESIEIPNIPLIEDKLPNSFQERRRKISAPPNLNPMTMDKSSHLFFAGGIFSSMQSQGNALTETSRTPETTGLASNFNQLESNTQNRGVNQQSLASATQMMAEANREPLVIEPKSKMGKRRPKPSALREMNFWAPQSM